MEDSSSENVTEPKTSPEELTPSDVGEPAVSITEGKPKIVFFGTDEFSIKILEIMCVNNFTPSLVVTAPDAPKGRKLILTPTLTKSWAHKNKIPVKHGYKDLASFGADLFVVASYGKMIPPNILELPKHGALNVHPSLLPKYRGPSPIQSAIISGDEKTGTTIMLLTAGMDEGPIIAQEELVIPENIMYKDLEEKLAELGGRLLVSAIPKWVAGEITARDQDENNASYTRLITKLDGKINWNENPEIIVRKMRAFNPWPGTYTSYGNLRVIITSATLDENGNLQILRVKPEGKNEMDLKTFLSNYHDFLDSLSGENSGAPGSQQ